MNWIKFRFTVIRELNMTSSTEGYILFVSIYDSTERSPAAALSQPVLKSKSYLKSSPEGVDDTSNSSPA